MNACYPPAAVPPIQSRAASAPRRGRDRAKRTALALACGGLALLGAADASAQDPAMAPASDGEFSVQRFEPAIGPRNFLTVAGGRTAGELTWSAGLMFDYQRDPFVVKSCISATDCSSGPTQDVAVVRDMLTWNAMGSLTPVEFVQIGLRVPVAFASGQGIDTATGTPAADGLSGVGLGDLMLEGKFRIVGEPEEIIVLAAAGDLSAPVGHATSEGNYIGNSTPLTGGVRAILDVNVHDVLLGANIRGVFKENATLGNSTLGPEFRYGAAAGYRFTELFRAFVEMHGSTVFSSANGTNAMEVDGAVQLTPVDGRLVITAGGGTGVLQGIGVPLARGIVGLQFNYENVVDDDGDGIDNEVDQCPTKAEDLDQIDDSDGCPEDDFDRDNIPDEVDKCPLEPETENGFKDDDGCPDEVSDRDHDGVFDEKDKCPDQKGNMRRPEFLGCPDSDQDGVADSLDKCPGEKEDTDGHEDLDGCFDEDNDGDGVPDISDECGNAAENINGVKDTDGCPDFGPDEDADGIEDDQDKCPDKAENYNGVKDDDGCPDAGGDLAEVGYDFVRVVDLVWQDNEITDARSKKALDALGNALEQWAEITKIELTVTAADEGVATLRANYIVKYLFERGVDTSRFSPKTVAGDESVKFKVLEAPPKP